MSVVAFVCAMPMEARPLARELSLRRAVVGTRRGYRGTCGARDAVLVVSGMGPQLAAAATEALFAAHCPGHVVVAGISGALENDTPIGTVVLPDRVVDGASGAEYRPCPLPFPRDAAALTGTLWTTAALITAPAELADLIERGVVALDMETAAVARVCEARGTPWSVVRVISDRASDGTVDAEVFGMSRQDGRPDPRAVARFVLRHPGRLPVLARMGRDASAAARTAAAVAARAAADLPSD